MLGKIKKLIAYIEDANPTWGLFFWSFLSLIFVRTLVEEWLSRFEKQPVDLMIYEFYHKFFFFLIALISFVFLLHKTLRVKIKAVANFLLFGYLILITPPLIDRYLSHGKGFWSFYDFGSIAELSKHFFTFFDNSPEIGITYGVRFEIAVSLIFIFIYSWIKLSLQNQSELIKARPFLSPINRGIPQGQAFPQKSKIKKLFGNCKLKIENLNHRNISKIFFKAATITLAVYIIFYILGTFPSWFTIFFQGFRKGFFNVTDIDTAAFFISPGNILSTHVNDFVSALNVKMDIIYSLMLNMIFILIFWISARKKLIAFIQNIRFPQAIYHSGLLLAGMGLGITFTRNFLPLNLINVLAILLALESVILAWLASVVINDLSDEKIDKITNPSRPLPQQIIPPGEYKAIGLILFFASIVFSSIISFKMAELLFFYQAIAWLYSAPPLRLKRFPLIASSVSAIASLMILFSGYILASPGQNLVGLPPAIIILLAFAYTLSLPIKDFKDIEGDKRDGVFTIPVIFGDEWGRLIVGGGIFISFLSSVVLLHELRLFWWAIIFGGASFWIINNKKINPRRLPWWILASVTTYGLILVKIIFI
jgi:4-hydroxybenzoate polyprenyltransferase